ncbi:MAG: ArsB/NhaD family transporter [Kiritimatiellia bacterium]
MLAAIAIFLATYFFIATEKVDKTVAAILGATAMIATRRIGYEDALGKIDLNVIFVLIGMMVVVNILASTGVFEWMSIRLAQRARGNGGVLMVALCLVTAGISSVLDNVTTVIMIAPVTILITQLLELPAAPLLILLAVFSNTGGTATMIGDPPNILIGSQTHLSFLDFLLHLAPIALIITLAAAAVVMLVCRNTFRVSEHVKARLGLTDPAAAIVQPGRLRRALPVLGLIFAGFFAGPAAGLETGIVALAGAFLMGLVCRMDLPHCLARVEWDTILFFAGLFMLVGGLEENGVFACVGGHLIRLTGGSLLATCLSVLWVSALISSIVDNIPLVISFIPILKAVVPVFAANAGLDPAGPAALVQIAEPLYWSLALGACLGGNGTLIGASANVVIARIANINKYRLTFMDFTRVGLPVMLLSVAVSSLYIWLRYFAFGR